MKDEIKEFLTCVIGLIIGFIIIFAVGDWLASQPSSPKHDGFDPGPYDYTRP